MTPTPEKKDLQDVSPRRKAEEKLVSDGWKRVRLGVWEAWAATQSRRSFTWPGKAQFDQIRGLRTTLLHVRRFLSDVYALGPRTVVAVWILGFLDSLLPGLSVYYSNKLLSTIEDGVTSGVIDGRVVQQLLVTWLVLKIVGNVLSWADSSCRMTVRNRAKIHFEELGITASLTQDLRTFEDRKTRSEHARLIDGGWIFNHLTEHTSTLLSAVSELFAMYRVAIDGNVGPKFLTIWTLRMLPLMPDDRNIFWYGGCIAYAINTAYRRMVTLQYVVHSEHHRQEIINGDLDSYLFRKCRQLLGDTPTVDFFAMLEDFSHPSHRLLDALMNEFPTIYYAAYTVLFGHAPFSFSTVASLQNGASGIKYRLEALFGSGDQSLPGIFARIREFYTELEVTEDSTAERLRYPVPQSSEKGMEVQLRDLTFNYPNSQLVVIVGANGSGKTSLVKMLTRLYKPTSGSIIIDGHPSSEYRTRALRQATAVLSQDHKLFPVSIRENISLGRPEYVTSWAEVEEASKKGGAHGVISKFNDGLSTILSPVYTKWHAELNAEHAIMKLYREIEKETEVSGGELQRLVASRTFMRMTDERVRLVIVDEPSAAMDPEGEFELFKHLREAREGRTMIFITHRFGHLTKHADLILCMKEGELVESGTHEELIAKKGEYHNLYNIQARAFAS